MHVSLIAGVVAALAGVLTFLVVHHLWILPIWFMLPMGVLLAVPGGLAVGWAHHELRGRLSQRSLPGGVTWTLLFVGVLAPTVVVSEVRSPILTGTNEQDVALMVSVVAAVAISAFELLVLPAVTGGLIGAYLGRSRAAIVSVALTGIALALGPGHNLPFLASSHVTIKGLALVLSVIVASAFTLTVTFNLVSGPLRSPKVRGSGLSSFGEDVL